MTRGEIERLKGIWEICFIAWTTFALTTIFAHLTVLMYLVVLGTEVALIFAGHWIAAQRPS